MNRDELSSLPLENRVEISKNQVEIEHSKSAIDRNARTLEEMDKKVSSMRRLVWLVGLLVIAIFVLIFINGMMVHRQTGLDEFDNQVFDGSDTPGQILD